MADHEPPGNSGNSGNSGNNGITFDMLHSSIVGSLQDNLDFEIPVELLQQAVGALAYCFQTQ